MGHLNQIQRAVDYIEDHLTDELLIESIAREAGISMWHFQNVFKATVGETVKNYLRSRRLTKAMMDLSTTDKRILDLALEAGFESQESFTRAFKQAFNRTPGECRAQGVKTLLALSKPRITMEYLNHLYGGMTMQPKIIEKEAMKIVGYGGSFISINSPDKNNFEVIPKIWGRYQTKHQEIKEQITQYSIGVCWCLDDAKLKSHPDECYYIAGSVVKNFTDVPEGMMTKEIPAGKYAVFTHKGTLQKLSHTMSYIYGSWAAQSEYKLRDAPDLEIYDERFKPDSEDSEFDLYIPVV